MHGLSSGGLAGAGVLILAGAAGPGPGLAGTALVGAAISVVTPTSYGIVGRDAPPDERGSTIGSVASLASLGMLGPAVVGQVASWTDPRTAIAALSVAALAICLLVFRVPAYVRRSMTGDLTDPGLLRRAPNLRLATPERELAWFVSPAIRSLSELPVRW